MLKDFLFQIIILIFALPKTNVMKALVKVNGKSVGMFYNITKEETQTEMHQRILNIIVYRYGMCSMDIQWQKLTL